MIRETGTTNGYPTAKDGAEARVSFWRLFLTHWLDVVTYCLVFGTFGMGVACLGPTLLDLGCQTGTDLREMSWVFFVQLLMTSIGSVAAGILANRCAVSFILLLAMIGMPLTMFIIPSCLHLASLVLTVMIMGLSMGCIDCIANLGMINLFDKNVSPFLQAMHFFYGLGAFVSPMVAEPFLLNVDCSPYIDGYSFEKEVPVNASFVNITEQTIPPSPGRLANAQNKSRLRSAFYIIGCIQLPITILVALVVLRKSGRLTSSTKMPDAQSTEKFPSEEKQSKKIDATHLKNCFTCGTKYVILITLVAAASMFIFDGLQSSYGGYVYSYSLKSITDLKQTEGAVLNACFWGTFAAGRLLSILLAMRLTAAFMLLCNILGGCLSMAVTVILRFNHIGIYAGTCLLGFSLSGASPTVLSLTEQFVDINPSITSTLVVCAGIGETLCPVIVGNLFVSLGPTSFLVFCFTIIVIALFLYATLWTLGKKTTKYTATVRDSFIWLTGYAGKKAGESTLIEPSTVKYYSRMQDSPSDENMELAAFRNEDDTNRYQKHDESAGGLHTDSR